MKKILLLCLALALSGIAWADKSKQVFFNGQVTCSSSTVTTQIMGWEPQRTEYALYNSSNSNVWIIYSTSTVLPTTFTSANSFLFNAGSAVTDSGNNVWVGYISCQSTGTATTPISAVDFGQ